MLRFTLMLVVMVATLAVNNDLMAQHRSLRNPFQSIGRQLGMGWGAGYHSANPGPIIDYYSPCTTSNISGMQWLQAPTIDTGGFEGPGYEAPRLPAPLPDLKSESSDQSNLLFQDSREVDQQNLFDQSKIQPLDRKPVQIQNQSHWQTSSNRGPVNGLRTEGKIQGSLKTDLREF